MFKNEVVIIGSGITSKLMALTLASCDCNVKIVEKENNKANTSNLTTFLSSSSINFLKSIGLDNLPNENYKISEISCSKLERYFINSKSQINFSEESQEGLGSVIINSDLNKVLNKKILENNNIKILVNSSNEIAFDNERKKLILDKNNEISVNLLIILDKQSKILKNFFKSSNFIKKNLNQTSLVMNVKSKTSNIAYQFFTKKGAIAFLPINYERASIVWSLENNSPELKFDKKTISNIIKNIFSKTLENFEVLDLQKYQLHLEYAKKIFSGPILLFGDAVHSIHPIAGQGLNLSIKDIKALKNKINKYKYLGYQEGSEMMLNEYANSRVVDNTLYTFGTEYMDRIFKSRNFVTNSISNLGIAIVENNKFFKNLIIRSATGNE